MFKYEDRFLFYDYDYIKGDEDSENNGVIYPQWDREDNGAIRLNLNYTITGSAVTDGETVAFAVIEPDTYGLSAEENIYSAKGFYIPADGGQKVSARMNFNNDSTSRMRNIIGYYGSREKGITPAEITPKEGDQFMFLDSWWTIDEAGNVVDELREGNVLTFGKEQFRKGISPEFIYPGEFYIGIMAEDMDGNQYFSFSPVTIQ